MGNTSLQALFKPVSSTIGWLGGGVAGLTVLLSSLGFLVLRSHHDLLGITGIVPIPPDSWTTEGARFLYNSTFFLMAGIFRRGWILLCVLLSALVLFVWSNNSLSAKVAAVTEHKVLKVLIIGCSFVGFLGLVVLFFFHESVSNLLVVHQFFDTEIVKRSLQNMPKLRERFALLEALLLLGFVWLICLPRLLNMTRKIATKESPDTPKKNADVSKEKSPLFAFQYPVWYGILWGIFLVSLILFPMNYGKLAVSNDFYKVRLFTLNELNDSHGTPQKAYEEGWLLYKDDTIIILYRGRAAAGEPIHILQRKNFARIHIVGLENIFTN